MLLSSAAGGTGTLQITTNRECAWSVQSDAPWVTFTVPPSGQGTASVQYALRPLPIPPLRRAPRLYAWTICSRRSRRAHLPVSLRLLSMVESLDETGGQRTVQVSTASAQCRWTAATDVPWITVAAGDSGSGKRDRFLHGRGHDRMLERTGRVTIAGLMSPWSDSRVVVDIPSIDPLPRSTRSAGRRC